METGEPETDLSVGLGMLFGVVGLFGALGMYVFAMGHDQVASGWSFAVAMVAAALAVAAVHAYA